jgi:hypothetical protein
MTATKEPASSGDVRQARHVAPDQQQDLPRQRLEARIAFYVDTLGFT